MKERPTRGRGRPPFQFTLAQEVILRDTSLPSMVAADKIGVSTSCVNRRRLKLGVKYSGTPGKPKVQVPEELLLDPSLTHQQVADLVGVSKQIVSHRRKDLGFRRYYPDIPWTEVPRYIDVNGYARLSLPGHPLAFGKAKKQAMEHKVVVYELGLGGNIEWSPDWVIHHRNEDKIDNRLENLVLFYDSAAHTRHHADLRNGMTEDESFASLGSERFMRFG